MKNTIITLASLSLITGTILSSCLTPDEKVAKAEIKVQEAKMALNNITQDSISEYQLFKEESEKKLYSFDKNISQLKIRLVTETLIDKAIFEKKLAILEQKNSHMKKRLEDYKDGGQNKWISFKNEFNFDMEELGRAFQDLTAKNTL